jgi:hypothetical protein
MAQKIYLIEDDIYKNLLRLVDITVLGVLLHDMTGVCWTGDGLAGRELVQHRFELVRSWFELVENWFELV